MIRRFPPILLAGAITLAATGCGKPEHRQVVLITVDTLRADRLGCYGYKGETSPGIDALAADAVRFQQTTAQAPWTSASFASLLTGRAPSEAWVLRQRMDPKVPHLAEILRNHEVTSSAIVSNPKLRAQSGFARGFDSYLELFQDLKPVPGVPTKVLADQVTDAALELLPKLENQDFFLWMLYMEPHRPFVRHQDKYYRGPWPLPEDVKVGGTPESQIRKLQGGLHPALGVGDRTDAYPPSREVQHAIDYFYDGEIRYVDQEVSRLLAGLRKQNLLNDVLLIFTADHGESLFDHYNYIGHGAFPFQSTVGVPLIMRWPGGRPGVVSEPVALVDIMPTILEYMGIPIPAKARGAPLTPQGRQKEPPILVQTVGWRHRALRKGPYKLVQWEEPSAEDLSLYQLEADPAELKDLGEVKPGEAHRLAVELTELLTSLEPASQTTPAPTPEPEIRDQLKALGYVD